MAKVQCYLAEMIEYFIDRDSNLSEIYSTSNTLEDFTINDIVKCTYAKGIYKIIEIQKPRIAIQRMDITDELLIIGPRFLKKVTAKEDVMRVLYENTGSKSR